MAQTTSDSVTELVIAKAVEMLITHYQYDEVNFLGFAHFKSLTGLPTATASFPREVKDAHSDLANEGTALTAVEFETTAVDVAVARLGIARNPTETSLEDTVMGRAAFMNWLFFDGARLIGEATEEDYAGKFADATNSVTDSGADAEILDLVEMLGKQRSAKARGRQAFNLSDRQLTDVQRSQIASTGTPWAKYFDPIHGDPAFGGFFMGHPIFASGKNPTANTGANTIGVVYSDGTQSPEYCAFAYVNKRNPVPKMKEEPLEDATYVAMIARRGVGTKAANFATKLVTGAT